LIRYRSFLHPIEDEEAPLQMPSPPRTNSTTDELEGCPRRREIVDIVEIDAPCKSPLPSLPSPKLSSEHTDSTESIQVLDKTTVNLVTFTMQATHYLDDITQPAQTCTNIVCVLTCVDPPKPFPCAITGLPAKYVDPMTGTPYATLDAWHTLQRMHREGDVVYRRDLKAYTTTQDAAAILHNALQHPTCPITGNLLQGMDASTSIPHLDPSAKETFQRVQHNAYTWNKDLRAYTGLKDTSTSNLTWLMATERVKRTRLLSLLFQQSTVPLTATVPTTTKSVYLESDNDLESIASDKDDKNFRM
jgi:hypothetical protein